MRDLTLQIAGRRDGGISISMSVSFDDNEAGFAFNEALVALCKTTIDSERVVHLIARAEAAEKRG